MQAQRAASDFDSTPEWNGMECACVCMSICIRMICMHRMNPYTYMYIYRTYVHAYISL